MHRIVTIGPFRCRVWQAHVRQEEYLTEASCKAEIESLASNGQLIQILGRPVKDDPACEVEVICGARRLFAARHLNLEVKVELREMCDREAALAIEIENNCRSDVSAYERGRCYANWLRAKYFHSQDDIARAFHLSRS